MSGTAADATTQDPALEAARGLHDAKQFAGAEAAYRSLLAARPADAAVLTELGDVLTDAGRRDEAVALYRRVVEAAPDDPSSGRAYDGLAAHLQDLGDVPGAVAASKRSAEMTGDADEVYRLGYTLQQMRRPADATEMYDLASRLRPGFAEAHAKVAAHLLATGDVAAAVARYGRAVDARPDMAELHINLAHAQHAADEDDKAIRTIRRAIDLKPDLPEGHNLLGVIFRARRRPTEALGSFTKAVQLKPDYAEAYCNLGLTLESVGRVADATTYFERAARTEPTRPHFHVAVGRHQMLLGDWAKGLPELEWRRADPRNRGARPFAAPMWDAVADLLGKTVLLYAERRPTDTVLFARYAKVLADRGAHVTVECPADLAPLLRTADGVAAVVGYGQPLPATDFQFPLLSLPLALRTSPTTVPNFGPYLHADPEKVAVWAGKLAACTGRRVGLVWAPDPPDTADRAKVCPPGQLAELAKVPGVTLVRLQHAAAAAPPEALAMTDVSADLTDPSELAAAIANLDLVIAVDSLTAHLAAAMGKPTWVLLPAVPDWRWMLDRPDSPWYPTAKLYRPAAIGDWAGVVVRVAADLATLSG